MRIVIRRKRIKALHPVSCFYCGTPSFARLCSRTDGLTCHPVIGEALSFVAGHGHRKMGGLSNEGKAKGGFFIHFLLPYARLRLVPGSIHIRRLGSREPCRTCYPHHKQLFHVTSSVLRKVSWHLPNRAYHTTKIRLYPGICNREFIAEPY